MPSIHSKKFLIVFLLSGLLLNLSVTVFGQSLFPKKDLIFAQVIAYSNAVSEISMPVTP